ncbi:MAG: extracellular solute-binding protein [Actinobacteria bacterium]|nr:extracellular solute-binding protein [Actinomycetota bacterium]
MRPNRASVAGVAVAALAALIAGCGSGGGGSSPSAAPSQLTVWRMGASTPAQTTWMNGVVAQFHKAYPAYAKTKVKVVYIPWTNRTTEWTNALSSGKNAPDITELGNTDTPTEASLGMLANISGQVGSWPGKQDIVPGMLANDSSGGAVYALPWFGGVRGIWYRKDQFAKAGISSPPTTWAQLVADAKALMKAYPGTYGIGAPSDYTNGIVSFIWGAGGQVAVRQGSKWVAQLNSPASEAGIKFYADLFLTQHLSPAKYIGQTELGNPGATSGGTNEDFALGKLDLYIDGPWAKAEFPKGAKDAANWASFPIPSEQGPKAAPAFAGGSDLGIWSGSKYKTASWDLLKVMDSVGNSTSFANAQGFFPPYTSQLTGGAYAGNAVMAGFAKAATVTQISPLNSKNWGTADATDQIIPTMMKSLMRGANFTATVNKANTELQNVLNTGKES